MDSVPRASHLETRAFDQSPRAFLERLYNAAVAAAHPSHCLPQHLPARCFRADHHSGRRQGPQARWPEIAERQYVDDIGVPPKP